MTIGTPAGMIAVENETNVGIALTEESFRGEFSGRGGTIWAIDEVLRDSQGGEL